MIFYIYVIFIAGIVYLPGSCVLPLRCPERSSLQQPQRDPNHILRQRQQL